MLLDDCLMKCLRLYCIDLYAAISDVIRLLPYESNSESNSQVRKLGNNPVVEQGSVLPTDQGSNPGIYTKKTPSPSKAQLGSPLVAGSPMCADRPFSRDTAPCMDGAVGFSRLV